MSRGGFSNTPRRNNLIPLEGGFETYTWVSDFSMHSRVDAAADRARLSTIVVNFSDEARDRLPLHALAHAVNDIRLENQVFRGPAPLVDFHEFCAADTTDWTTALLVLGPLAASNREQVIQTIGTLAAKEDLLVFVIAECPSSWAALPDIDGFVQADAGWLGSDAAQLAVQYLSLTAPRVMLCADFADWQLAMGVAHAPGVMSLALWDVSRPLSEPVFVRPIGKFLVEQASAVALTLAWAGGKLSATRQIIEHYGKLMKEDAALVVSISEDFIRAEHMLVGRYVSLIALCKP